MCTSGIKFVLNNDINTYNSDPKKNKKNNECTIMLMTMPHQRYVCIWIRFLLRAYLLI